MTAARQQVHTEVAFDPLLASYLVQTDKWRVAHSVEGIV